MIYIHDRRENLSAGDQSGLANGPGDYPVYGARVPQYDNILFIYLRHRCMGVVPIKHVPSITRDKTKLYYILYL